MCLTYFASYYAYSKNASKTKNVELSDSEEETEGEYTVSSNWVKLLNNLSYVRRREKGKVIRFCRFSRAENDEEFYREQLMLPYPWRNEQLEILDPNINLQEKFEAYSESIKVASLPFNRLGGENQFELLLEAMRAAEDGVNEAEIHSSEGQPLKDFEYDEQIGDVSEDIIPGGRPRSDENEYVAEVVRQTMSLSEQELQTMARSLNADQRDLLQHVVYFFETASVSPPPINIFVSGGAGVEKSLLIKAIYQSVTHVFNRSPGSHPDDIRILLWAPTAKAAFGIGGQTIHSAFALLFHKQGTQWQIYLQV
ncbi:unnamed protein product [Hermetia illucens]|uniref:ATP-dependent DNA helicase n=1 Tax=Hermetia illucens TaxID=343691 RepID=A0A7R8UCX1_HERIL|nr:unnamed protein product [Hermetia illucens]